MSGRPVSRTSMFILAMQILLAALWSALPAVHAASPKESDAKLNRLIDVSGIRHSAQQVLPSMLASIDAPQPRITAQVRAGMRDAAAQAFQPDPIIERMRTRLSANLSARQIDDTLAWLDGDLGRRITTMENETSDPGSYASIQAYGRDLQQRPPSKQRSALIRDLDRATGSSDLAASILEGTALATALGVNASNPASQQLQGEALRKQVKAGLAQTRKEMDQMVMISLFYTYRTLSDQELESYLKFLSSPSGAAYCKSANAAMNDAILDAIGRFMVALPKSLQKSKGAVGT